MDGTCFGYAVDAPDDVPFAYVRGGTGASLVIALNRDDSGEPTGPVVHEWRVGERFHARLHKEGPGRFRLATPDTGSFAIDSRSPRIAVPTDGNVVKREERIWGVPAALCVLARGDHPLHAAAVDIGGEAIVLGAPGTFGKSTLAAGFVAAGHRLLTEDLCCLASDETAAVVPGPAMLRLRPDVAGRLELPHATALDAGDERLHLALDPRTRGDCEAVPLRAVLLLRRHDGPVAVERVPPEAAMRDLFALGFRLTGAEEAARSFRSTAALVARTPVWNLVYRHRLDELPRTVEAVLRAI